MRTTLLLGLSIGLVLQGGVAQAEPIGNPPTTTTQSDASADASGGQGSAESDSSAGDHASSAIADADADTSNGSAADSAQADSAAAGSESDSTADGDLSADGTGTAAGLDAEGAGDQSGEITPTPTPSDDPNEEPTSTPTPTSDDETDEAVDESLGLERSLRAMAASTSLSSGFNAGYIISDQNFYNGSAMTTSQIQTFLNQKIGRCTIGDPGRAPGSAWGSTTLAWSCLNGALWTTDSRGSNAYCKGMAGGYQQSSAAIIAKVAQACGVSPRVLLVMLEKEQSLISDTWPTIRQFDFAMGYDCPDSGPNNSANCNGSAGGFPSQVYRAAWQLKVYKANPGSYNYRPYQTNTIQWHPNIGCGTSQVYLENYATAALYIYTPYRPNQAALNAGWGTGDSCSSYGNRNFYQFYKAWFGSPNSAFPDVAPSSKFFTEIEWMAATGLTTGTNVNGRQLYLPKNAVSREAMAAFLYRLDGAKFSAPKVSPFADVQPGDKFYKEITWMYAKGYSTGTRQPSGKPMYFPKSGVSREAMAAFIYRFQGGKYTGPASSPFVDVRRGDKFYNEIAWMYARGYSTGNKQPSGKPAYLPRESVTREAMAAFIYRLKN